MNAEDDQIEYFASIINKLLNGLKDCFMLGNQLQNYMNYIEIELNDEIEYWSDAYSFYCNAVAFWIEGIESVLDGTVRTEYLEKYPRKFNFDSAYKQNMNDRGINLFRRLLSMIQYVNRVNPERSKDILPIIDLSVKINICFAELTRDNIYDILLLIKIRHPELIIPIKEIIKKGA